jgi:hypothetical protein
LSGIEAVWVSREVDLKRERGNVTYDVVDILE